MQIYYIAKMNDFSNQQIAETKPSCGRWIINSLAFSVGTSSDGIEANVNGMVHPDFRRQGVFRASKPAALGFHPIPSLVSMCEIFGRGF